MVEILKGMMSTKTTSSPLQDDREIGIGCDLVNAIYGSRFERNVSNSSSLPTIDNLDSFLSGQNTGSDTESEDPPCTFLATAVVEKRIDVD